MADNLRICKAFGYNAPVGSKVTFDGEYIGHVIDNKDGYCEIAINSDIVNCFDGIETTTLTGNCSPDRFTTKRVIIIEMK